MDHIWLVESAEISWIKTTEIDVSKAWGVLYLRDLESLHKWLISQKRVGNKCQLYHWYKGYPPHGMIMDPQWSSMIHIYHHISTSPSNFEDLTRILYQFSICFCRLPWWRSSQIGSKVPTAWPLDPLDPKIRATNSSGHKTCGHDSDDDRVVITMTTMTMTMTMMTIMTMMTMMMMMRINLRINLWYEIHR